MTEGIYASAIAELWGHCIGSRIIADSLLLLLVPFLGRSRRRSFEKHSAQTYAAVNGKSPS
jgi:hypothetical protein